MQWQSLSEWLREGNQNHRRALRALGELRFRVTLFLMLSLFPPLKSRDGHLGRFWNRVASGPVTPPPIEDYKHP